MYIATIKIQALFRGRFQRVRYLKIKRKKIEERSIRLLQRAVRGHQGRSIAAKKRLEALKVKSAIKCQNMVRCKIARSKVAELRKQRIVLKAVCKMQSIIRGYLARKNVHEIAIQMHQIKVIVRIQKRIRGIRLFFCFFYFFIFLFFFKHEYHYYFFNIFQLLNRYDRSGKFRAQKSPDGASERISSRMCGRYSKSVSRPPGPDVLQNKSRRTPKKTPEICKICHSDYTNSARVQFPAFTPAYEARPVYWLGSLCEAVEGDLVARGRHMVNYSSAIFLIFFKLCVHYIFIIVKL